MRTPREQKKCRDREKQNENSERRKEIPNAVESVIPNSENKIKFQIPKKIKYFECRVEKNIKIFRISGSLRFQTPKKNLNKFRRPRYSKFRAEDRKFCDAFRGKTKKKLLAPKKSQGSGLDSGGEPDYKNAKKKNLKILFLC